MQGFEPQNKRMKKANFKDVDDALHAWMRAANALDIPISGPILQTNAQELTDELGHLNFKCSNGWLSTDFVAPASASVSEHDDDPDDDISLAQLIESLLHASMEVSAEDVAVYNTVDYNLLITVPMTIEDINKEVLDNKAAKDPEDEIPEEEEDPVPHPPPATYSILPLPC